MQLANRHSNGKLKSEPNSASRAHPRTLADNLNWPASHRALPLTHVIVGYMRPKLLFRHDAGTVSGLSGLVELDAGRAGGKGQGRSFHRHRIRTRVRDTSTANRIAIQTALERRRIRFLNGAGPLDVIFEKPSRRNGVSRGEGSRPQTE